MMSARVWRAVGASRGAGHGDGVYGVASPVNGDDRCGCVWRPWPHAGVDTDSGHGRRPPELLW